jgi:hypothetical protein
MIGLPWIERTWTFDTPHEVFPGVIERLRGTPARVEELVADLTPAELVRHEGDAWSIQQNVGHLADLERLPRTRLEEFLAGAEVLTHADMSNRATEEARHDDRPIAELLTCFREARTELVARLDTLAPEDFARTALHPRLKTPMRLVDMCLFQADHDDHHLARISELVRSGRSVGA